MRNKYSFRPNIERLEDRWVPATTRFISGNLLITLAPSENVTLTQDATTANKFTVASGTSSVTFNGVSNILLTGSNGADTVTVDFGAKSYTGNMTLNLGNGGDNLALTGTGGGTKGNVQVLTGLGDDLALVSANVGGLLSITNTLGSDSVGLGGVAATTFGGDVQLTNIRLIGIGGVSIGGNLTIQNSQANLGNGLFLTATTVNKSLTVTQGAGPDFVVIDQLTVNGPTNISLGEGADNFQTNFFPNTFNGSFTLNAGGGADFVSFGLFGDSTAFNGNATFNQGAGDDILILSDTTSVAGNLSVTSQPDGNGNIGAFVGAQTAGNVSFNLGNGDNTIGFGGTVGGTLRAVTGNGNNTMTIGGNGGFYQVDLHFGTGDDTLTLTGAPSTISGIVDLGGGVNVFDQDGWTIASPWTLNGA